MQHVVYGCAVYSPRQPSTCSTGFVLDFDLWNSSPSFNILFQNWLTTLNAIDDFPTTVQNPEKNLQSRTWTGLIVTCECCSRPLGCFPKQTLFIFLICPQISDFFFLPYQKLAIPCHLMSFVCTECLCVSYFFKCVTCVSWLLFTMLCSSTIAVKSLRLMSFVFDGIKLSGKSLRNRAALTLRFINHCNWWQIY